LVADLGESFEKSKDEKGEDIIVKLIRKNYKIKKETILRVR
jgi:hypothetical protein